MLTYSSSCSISLTLFCKAASSFNNITSISSAKLGLNGWSACDTKESFYAPPTICCFASSLKPLEALKTKWMLFNQVVCTIFCQFTLMATTTRKRCARYHLHFKHCRLSRLISDSDLQSSVTWDQQLVATRTACYQPSRYRRGGLQSQTTCFGGLHCWWGRIKKSENSWSSYKDSKQSLMHSHCICSWLQHQKWLLNPAFVATIISAEILNEQNPLLCQVIFKPNRNNFCRHSSPSVDCMIENFCWKHFPEVFIDKTDHEKSRLPAKNLRRSSDSDHKNALWAYQNPDGASTTSTAEKFGAVPFYPKLSAMFSLLPHHCALGFESS